MTLEEKCNLLNTIIEPMGFSYLADQDIFTSTRDAWQRKMAVTQWANQPVQEPEIMEHLAAWTYRLIGREDIFYPRLYASLFWLIGGVALYLLLKKLTGTDGAVVGVAVPLWIFVAP